MKNNQNISYNTQLSAEGISILRKMSIIIGFFLLMSIPIINVILQKEDALKELGIILVITIPFFTAAYINVLFPLKGKINYPFLALLPFIAVICGIFSGHRPTNTINSILWLYICSNITYKRAMGINLLLIVFYILIDLRFGFYTPILRFYNAIAICAVSVFGFISTYIQQKTRDELNHQHALATTAAEELENELQHKTELYAGLAHEIKTPLTIIRHYFSRYRQNSKDSRELQILQDSLDKLERQIVNFMKYEKEIFLNHNSGIKEKKGNCSLSMLIQKNIPLLESYFSRKNVLLSSDIEPGISVELTQVDCEHIFLNLVENALRYSPIEGKVSVTLRRSGKDAILSVSDNGIGISPENIEKIFTPYIQLKEISSSKQGIGIGLSIVKDIVAKAEGNIKVDSTPGEGSTFTVTLPVSTHSTDLAVTDLILPFNTPQIPGKKHIKKRFKEPGMLKRLMIIEDNEDLRSFLEEYLSEHFDVVSCENGQDALSCLDKENIPDLLISDVYMDEMDGMTFFDRFHEEYPDDAVPFLFISADDTEKMRLKGLGKGAVDYIVKPFSPEELKLKVSSWLSIFSSGKDKELEIINTLSERYGLTSRENQVALMLIQGLPRKTISDKLYISPNTVKTHVASIYSKCLVASKTEFLKFIEDLK